MINYVIPFFALIILIRLLLDRPFSWKDFFFTLLVAAIVVGICTAFLIWLINFMATPVTIDPIVLSAHKE